jgi:VWFA-related protein
MREYLKFADGAEAAKTLDRIAQLEQSASKAVPESNATFRVQSDLTLVRFPVTRAKGQFLKDLRPDEFEILEDEVSRKIALFEGGRFYPRRVPLEITLLFDCSCSMDAADILNTKVFEKNLLEEYENVSVAIYGFSEELVRLTQPTRDGRLLAKAMTAALGVRRGSTPLFGYMAQTVREAAATKGNATRMLVVFSDGLSSSPGDEQRSVEASRVAQQLGVAIYPVLITATIPSRPTAPTPLRSNRPALATPATVGADSLRRYSSLASTGGHAFHEVSNQDILPRILSTIAKEIRYDYVAGYYSSASDSEKSRQGRGEVAREEPRSDHRWRSGNDA